MIAEALVVAGLLLIGVSVYVATRPDDQPPDDGTADRSDEP